MATERNFQEQAISELSSDIVLFLSEQHGDKDIGVRAAALRTAASCLDNAISLVSTATIITESLNNIRRR